MSSLSLSFYAVFDGYSWEASYFLKGNRVDLGDRGGAEEKEEWREGKLTLECIENSDNNSNNK